MKENNKEYNLVLSGLGGQGIMTISRIFAIAASIENIDVKLFEGTGMTQRGGGVYSFVRFGKVNSPKIPEGRGDAIICLEPSEIVSVINLLKREGQIWINSGMIHDYYTKLRPDLYPAMEKLEAMMGIKTHNIYIIPASRLAEEIESPEAVNIVMMGAFLSCNPILKNDSITYAIEKVNKKYSSENIEAYWKGYQFRF